MSLRHSLGLVPRTYNQVFIAGICDARLPRSGGIPYIFKVCEKSPFAEFVPQPGITGRDHNKPPKQRIYYLMNQCLSDCILYTYDSDTRFRGRDQLNLRKTNEQTVTSPRSTYLERILWKFLYTYSVVIWIFSQTLRIYFTIVYFVSIILAMFSKKSTERRIWEKLPIIW